MYVRSWTAILLTMICRYAAAESCVWALGVLDEGVISPRVLRINISPISTLAPIVMGAEATGMSIQVLLYVARITGDMENMQTGIFLQIYHFFNS